MRRVRVGIAAAIVGLAVFAAAAPAFAQEQEHDSDISHVGECVEEAHEQGTDPEDCVEAPNPILPETSELVWGALSFIVLFFVLAKFAYPGIKKGMEERANKIRNSIDEAERTRAEAQSILDEYQRQLTDAKNEAARIIEEARQAADKLRGDLRRQAEAEVSELRQRAQEDIQAQVDRAMADLQSRVAELSIELAEKVVERSLDRETNIALIESYINQVGSQR
jgi:F-type H+-transporting ATPase subunit b